MRIHLPPLGDTEQSRQGQAADQRDPRAHSWGPGPQQDWGVWGRAGQRKQQTKALGTKAGYISGLEAYEPDNGSPLCWGPGCWGAGESRQPSPLLQLWDLGKVARPPRASVSSSMVTPRTHGGVNEMRAEQGFPRPFPQHAPKRCMRQTTATALKPPRLGTKLPA